MVVVMVVVQRRTVGALYGIVIGGLLLVTAAHKTIASGRKVAT